MDFLPDIEKFKNFFDGTDSKNEISIAVEEAKKYDIFNLISRVSALNLFHQNQTKSVILDTYIEGVLCQTRDQFPSKYTISSGKFRKIINQISDTSLKYSIDPPENMFVQNIMFYGNYRVLNGIDQTPAYNLQHMISVLFAKGIEYPKEFLDATYILVNGMLEISEKIVGGILNTENNHDTDEEKSIMIPSAMELNKYTELVIINGADFRKLFLNRIELLDLVTIEFGVQFEGDFDNKSFYTRPFLYNEEKDQYILLNAGLLPTAIVFWITCLAKKYGIFEEVLENYNDYIFHECQKYLCNLGHKKVLESQMSIDLFSSSGYKEYIASVQNNQLVIVQYLYDDGKNYNACTLHSTIEKKEFNDVVSKRLSYHYSKIIEYGVEKEDIFVIIIITRLEGAHTYFLPFNQGSNGAGKVGGKGNPVNPNGYDTAYLWERVLCKDSLMEILQKYMHLQQEYDKNGNLVKETMIFPRYHQLDVVTKLLEDVKKNGSGKSYLIQHSAGSGKSNSIAWLAHRLTGLHDYEDNKIFQSVIIVTDRRVLDSQLESALFVMLLPIISFRGHLPSRLEQSTSLLFHIC